MAPKSDFYDSYDTMRYFDYAGDFLTPHKKSWYSAKEYRYSWDSLDLPKVLIKIDTTDLAIARNRLHSGVSDKATYNNYQWITISKVRHGYTLHINGDKNSHLNTWGREYDYTHFVKNGWVTEITAKKVEVARDAKTNTFSRCTQ